MARQNQEFGEGDVVLVKDCNALAIIRACIQEEDGSWWYEVEPVEFRSFPREVSQNNLRHSMRGGL